MAISTKTSFKSPLRRDETPLLIGIRGFFPCPSGEPPGPLGGSETGKEAAQGQVAKALVSVIAAAGAPRGLK